MTFKMLAMDDDKVSIEFTVRPLEEGDLPRVLELYSANMANILAGVEPIDALRSITDSGSAQKHEAWIVETSGTVIGLAMVVVERDSFVHLKLLCVAADAPKRQQIVRDLAEMVMRYTWESGGMKLIVHTALPAGRFIDFMHAFGFDFSRERDAGDQHVVEFYRNLYERPPAFDA